VIRIQGPRQSWEEKPTTRFHSGRSPSSSDVSIECALQISSSMIMPSIQTSQSLKSHMFPVS
jgi:hypothetical protein